MLSQFEDSTISNRELVGFRFMLLAWIVALGLALFSGYSYYQKELVWDVIKAEASSKIKCDRQHLQDIPACNSVEYGASAACQRSLALICPMESMVSYGRLADTWEERSDTSLYIALAVFLVSICAFYGIRWGTTGRIKPLWLFKK